VTRTSCVAEFAISPVLLKPVMLTLSWHQLFLR